MIRTYPVGIRVKKVLNTETQYRNISIPTSDSYEYRQALRRADTSVFSIALNNSRLPKATTKNQTKKKKKTHTHSKCTNAERTGIPYSSACGKSSAHSTIHRILVPNNSFAQHIRAHRLIRGIWCADSVHVPRIIVRHMPSLFVLFARCTFSH